MASLDYRNPDYLEIFTERAKRLSRLRANPKSIPVLKSFYKENPIQFITDWGVTFDPRNVEKNQPSIIPFVLFERQEDFLAYVLDKWKSGENGLAEKSRDTGVSWLCVSLAATLCLFYDGLVIGFGSRKEEYVDKKGSPKSLFWKARFFIENLPMEFRGGWTEKHAPHMLINFPETGSTMSGEAGDGIGRGDRTGLYFVDESAYLERPQLVESSLSQTTNCRIDVSTPHGMDNPFAEKRHAGKIDVFTFHWREDPRKNEEWYEKQCNDLDPVTIAQEIDLNYQASVEGIVIPSEWVQAAIGAHKKLGLEITGERKGALDVADEGKDLNAFSWGYGVLIESCEDWSGKGSDIYQTVEKAFSLCDINNLKRFDYDADGLGAGVRGDAKQINNKRKKAGKKRIFQFRGSDGVAFPDKEAVEGRTNKDFFLNAKAQAWWNLRIRFQKTFRALKGDEQYPMDEMVFVSENMDKGTRLKLCNELSQPTYSFNTAGKMQINKKPEGSRSPNLGDSAMIYFAHKTRREINYSDLV